MIYQIGISIGVGSVVLGFCFTLLSIFCDAISSRYDDSTMLLARIGVAIMSGGLLCGVAIVAVGGISGAHW
jgi:hypothetical protein